MRTALRTLALLTAPIVVSACGDAPRNAPAVAAAKAAVQANYRVEGMHCNGCAEAIVAEVSEVKGVDSVQCTFESGEARITLGDPGAREAAERAITKLGYRISPAVPAAQAPVSK